MITWWNRTNAWIRPCNRDYKACLSTDGTRQTDLYMCVTEFLAEGSGTVLKSDPIWFLKGPDASTIFQCLSMCLNLCDTAKQL